MLSGDGKNMLEKEIRNRLKTAFGKGPERIEISYDNEMLAILLGGFLTKVERLRMKERGGTDIIRDFRYNEMKKEIEQILKKEAFRNIVPSNVYIDVHANEDSACFVVFATKE